jgi:flagellar hook-basal body complex protein FliE
MEMLPIAPIKTNINPLSSNLTNLLNVEPVKNDNGILSGLQGPTNSFSDIFTESLRNTAVSDTMDKVSQVELLTGQTDDMSGLLLDAQKAEISLNLALQLRNKVVDAYSEIMRMSL